MSQRNESQTLKQRDIDSLHYLDRLKVELKWMSECCLILHRYVFVVTIANRNVVLT